MRLIEIAADQPADEVRVQGMPKNAADHAGKSSINSRTEAGRLSGSDSRKLRVNQYARAVDHEVRGVLAGRDVPLILAAAEPIASVYRSVNSYRHLVDKTVEGNPSLVDAGSGGRFASGARRLHAEQLAAVRDTFNVRTEQGRTQTDVADVATAATYGQVDTVFIDIDSVVPGSLDPQTGALTTGESTNGSTYGVVDEIARRALLTGARVLAVRAEDIPGGGAVAAILRFAP
ncbi:hypothetical protein ACETU7_22995 [Rhodococcus sp. 3Y1]